jgi:hypothetical protein
LLDRKGVDNKSGNFSASSNGHTDDRLMLLPAGPNNRNVTHKAEYGFLSYFGRLDYGYAQKYFVDFSVRSDASSRFGYENRKQPSGLQVPCGM